ncbi:MAG TPA: TonB-dependent receptor, partial [Myxococcaceae bacterium]|nr:TonB-dependent receptor [Myxococcaceae bacterium]
MSAPPAGAPRETAPIERLDIETLLALPVVTASGKEESRALASANVVSVTREDIQAHGWRSLAEVLQSIPGLYVIDEHVNSSVGVRGVTGGLGAGTRIVRVMVDGVQVNFRPDLSAFIGPEFIPIETVERVEVAKGPLSALYGANAFLATVNVITRKGEKGSTAEVGLRFANVHRRDGMGASGSAGYRGASGGVLAAFSVDRIDRSGLFIQRTFSAQDPSLPRYTAFFSGPSRGDLANPVSGYLHLDAGNDAVGTFSLRGGYQRLDSMGEFRLSSALTHRSRVVLENFWTSARHDRKWSEAFSTQISLGYSRGGPGREYRLQLTSNPLFEFVPRVGYWATTGQAEAAYTGVARLELRGGVDAEYQMQQALHYEQIYLAPQGYNLPGDRATLVPGGATTRYPVSNLGSYLQAGYSPIASLPSLRLTGNVRLDHIVYGPVRFPLQHSWRAAAVYGITADLSAKLVAGRAFQTPSGVLMFAYPGFGYFNNVIGNVNVGLGLLRALRQNPQTK